MPEMQGSEEMSMQFNAFSQLGGSKEFHPENGQATDPSDQ